MKIVSGWVDDACFKLKAELAGGRGREGQWQVQKHLLVNVHLFKEARVLPIDRASFAGSRFGTVLIDIPIC